MEIEAIQPLLREQPANAWRPEVAFERWMQRRLGADSIDDRRAGITRRGDGRRHPVARAESVPRASKAND